MKRIQDLENVVKQLESRSCRESGDEEDDGTATAPYSSTFKSTVTSPPSIIMSNEAEHQDQAQNVLPIANSIAQVPITIPDYPISSVMSSFPEYTQPQNTAPIITGVVQLSARAINQPISSIMPSFAQSVQQSGGPQYTYVSTPQYRHLVSAPQNVYTAGAYATHVPQYMQGMGTPQLVNARSAPVYLQPTYAPPAFVATPTSHVTSAMNIKDIIMILPDFDPTDEKSLSSKQFVQRVQTLKNAYQWSDDILLFAVQQKLRGHAKLWIDSQYDIFVTWEQFSLKLIETFPFNDNAADAHIKMANTVRGANETPQEYYYKMLALGAKYGMTENVIARHVINGINEENLKRKISNQYFSCGELLRDIDSYCHFNDVKGTCQKQKSFSNSQIVQQRNVGKYSQDRMTYEKQNDKAVDKRIRCYNCSKHGHVAARCPEPQRVPKCSSCQKHHHAAAGCTSAKPAANVKKINGTRDQPPEILKRVEINDWVGQGIVDSGSDRTLIRKSVMEQLGPAEECHVILNGFGGGQYICTASKKLAMIIDGAAHEVSALVVDDSTLEADILLGRDVLCQQGVRVVIENDNCWIEEVNAATSEVSKLEPHEREKLKGILAGHRDCFSENIQELGTCTMKKMEIKVTTDTPISVKPYRVAFAKREEARKIIDELLQAKIIEHSESPYASPVVLVPKRDGSLRMCVDYRLLNRITVKMPFPMPIIEEQFAEMTGNRYFTSMDLRMGYHQVEIQEESRKYTGFVTLDGHYQYTRMPFGLVNAPAVFQSLMNTIASKLQPGEVIAYMDDVVIPSKTADEGLERLTKFLKVKREAGLTLRLDKCTFLATQISFLGHIISAEGITPGNTKVSAIQNFKTPTNVTEVRRFLGLTGFFRKFIPNYALLARPLTKMLHKSEAGKFAWCDEQKYNFRKLIELLCEKPVLALYDPKAKHEVHTDASKVGLAGVLLQSQDDANWRAVFYYSRHCTDAESRYHAYEQEVLAVVETLTRFRVYLLGKRFRLVTDCSAIAKAKTQKELIPKIARWYMRLMEYDFEAVHRPGTQLAHVDALSRAPNEPSREVETAGFVYRVMIDHDDWLYTMQMQDERLRHIILVLKGEIKDDQESQFKKEYQLKQSRLYRKADGLKFVVPKAVRWRVVKSCHDDVGHFGPEKTIARIKEAFWFPRIRNYVKSYIAACIDCAYAKAHGGKSEGQLHIGNIDPRPFATLHIDHLGPFVKSARGMSYILAISDAFSKFLIVKAVRSTKTGPVISALLEVTGYFGLPTRVISDRGTAFTSKVFAQFCETNCIKHIKTAVRTPRANGQVERANQTILASLRTSQAKPTDWDLQLRNIQWAVNSQKNTTTGYTPNELVFDFSLRDLTHNKMIAVLNDEESGEGETQTIHEKRKLAAENIATEQEKWKQRFDRRHKLPRVYDEGALVLLEHEPPATGDSRKLEPKFKGPYIISKVLGNDRYLITDVPGMQMSQKPFESVYCVDKIKPWCSNPPELDGIDDIDSDDEQSLEDESQAGKAEISGNT